MADRAGGTQGTDRHCGMAVARAPWQLLQTNTRDSLVVIAQRWREVGGLPTVVGVTVNVCVILGHRLVWYYPHTPTVQHGDPTHRDPCVPV